MFLIAGNKESSPIFLCPSLLILLEAPRRQLYIFHQCIHVYIYVCIYKNLISLFFPSAYLQSIRSDIRTHFKHNTKYHVYDRRKSIANPPCTSAKCTGISRARLPQLTTQGSRIEWDQEAAAESQRVHLKAGGAPLRNAADRLRAELGTRAGCARE